jgi:apolipoprotein N-acyltransferase
VLAVGAASFFGVIRMRALPLSQGDAEGVDLVVVSGLHLDANPVRAYASATARRPGAEVVIWPEGTIPGYLQEETASRGEIAARARERVGLLLGARRYEGSGLARRYFNSVFLFDGQGRIVAGADKQRLVPVAESSPLSWLHELPRPYTPAQESPTPLPVGGMLLGPLICWDVLFDDLSRTLVRRGADLLVNVSSDRDIGAGRAQLIAFARFRAIETRRWLARASGTGESLWVDPAGRVLARDLVRLAPDVPRPLTFYVRHGEVVPLTAALLLVLLGSWQRLRRLR